MCLRLSASSGDFGVLKRLCHASRAEIVCWIVIGMDGSCPHLDHIAKNTMGVLIDLA